MRHHVPSRSFLAAARRAALLLIVAVVAALTCASALAHPATERYIPIGYWQSVGVTGTYLGPMLDVAPQGAAVRFADRGADMSVRITDATRIYIDRSHLGLPNLLGRRDDLRPGVVAEVKMSTTDPGAVEWIKIRGQR